MKTETVNLLLSATGTLGVLLLIFADVISPWFFGKRKRRPVSRYDDNNSLVRLRFEVACAETLLSAQDTGKVIYVHDPETGELEQIRILMKDWSTGEVEFQHLH